MIVAFCGHSKFRKTEECERKVLQLLESNIADASAEIYLGGYGNFDTFAYDCCKKYKESHPKVSLVFITPYITDEYQKNYLSFQKTKYDHIIYPEIENKPLRFAILYRNEWMVEKADLIICGIDHDWGGAFKMYSYAKKKRKRILNVIENEY